ncbi:MAG: hypothetical protein UU72_C0024G0001 [candidate division WWE3 bacterium GW2011_GWB1_41_6]|uniref:Uncharacterized protein n=1 Tax=candidate division WWE3 bacterium GW2011_GWB1_41_6 TaxID=1619112 RepID=A0A0G0WU46_UNCKA|nr:MAG: hypothetical protein UU72_C0024G0001 [candidate division WWE3 bacterium GW2011_GWB1_41_6]
MDDFDICQKCKKGRLKFCGEEYRRTAVSRIQVKRTKESANFFESIGNFFKAFFTISVTAEGNFTLTDNSDLDFCMAMWCTHCGLIVADHDKNCPVSHKGYPHKLSN